MKKDVFMPADILIPEGISHEKWCVVACDQFSSEREYWDRVSAKVGNEPSTLNMIIPEAYLEDFDESEGIEKISAAMEDYFGRGLFREIKDSFVYVERTQSDGHVRRGLVGAVDLEKYDFSNSNEASILATEGTVLDRLPVRIRVRRKAKLEMPHIMAFIDDKDGTVIEPLTKKAGSLPVLYDFDLMEGGGHLKGMLVQGDEAGIVVSAIRALHDKSRILMVIGDGNHSLAAAKVYWDELKKSLSAAERETHPARMALVEVNNVYESAIEFEAIHRVVFDADPADFISAFEKAMPKGSDFEFEWIYRGKSGITGVRAESIGEALTIMQEFVDDYVKNTGCRIDYIHGEETARRFTEGDNCAGLILPAMGKEGLFETVIAGGVFPKKSFSVGSARDKRYYFECRAIKND